MTAPAAPSAPPAATIRLATSRGKLAAVQHPAADPRGGVLLVPGFTGSKEDFGAVLAPIAAGGFTVTAIDQRGQHESPWGSEQDYAFDRLASDVLAVAGQLPQPLHLVGHSLGGLIARRAVIADPTAFASLTLLSSGPAGLVGPRRDELTDLLADLLSTDVATLFDRQLAADRAAGRPPRPAALTAFLRARALASCPNGLAVTGAQLRDEPDLVKELRATAVRTLVLYGKNDNAWPPALQQEMAARLGATRVVIPAAAHSPATEAPEATSAELLHFWTAAK